MSWIAGSMAVLAVALAAGFAWYERSHPGPRVLALVATLAALAALGRVAFAPLPNVKPTTDIVLLAGYVLGGAPGFAVGAVGALASNLFFGQGPWTPWQMAAWGAVGVGGAGLARVAGRRLGRVPLAVACGAAGLGFGAVMNLHLWVTYYAGEPRFAQLEAIFASSLPFDVAHAVGNVLFCLAFGPALVRALARYRTRFEVRWLAAPAVVGAAIVLAVGAAAPRPADAAAPRPADAAASGRSAAAAAARPPSTDTAAVSASVRYLLAAENADGGWGAAPGQRSTQLHTGWAAMGLAAAGHAPPRAVAYMRAHARELTDIGSVERTILALRAAGASARDVGGRDLVAALLRGRRADGSFAGRVNTTAFAVLALRAAGRPARDRTVGAAARWIAAQAAADGGFNFQGGGGPSDIDDTGAAIQALVAAGRRGSMTVRRAAIWLVRHQNADGGFPLQPGAGSNAQSTAWAVQGLLAAGRDPAKLRRGTRDPLGYLRSLTAPSGEVRYSASSRQTPVWVTGQALMALAHKPLPLRPARPAATGSGGARPRSAGGGPGRTRPAASGTATAGARGGGAPANGAGSAAPARARAALAHARGRAAHTVAPSAGSDQGALAEAGATWALIGRISAAASTPQSAYTAGWLAGLAVASL